MGNAPFILAIGALWVMAWWNIFSKAGFIVKVAANRAIAISIANSHRFGNILAGYDQIRAFDLAVRPMSINGVRPGLGTVFNVKSHKGLRPVSERVNAIFSGAACS